MDELLILAGIAVVIGWVGIVLLAATLLPWGWRS